ncbi:helix-turn-helix domain-containing protein [Flavobacteriaceae bacterium R38]|nr:helix-turn-helix domain-containing protein [Flavobacteriaceae bacterium R38]
MSDVQRIGIILFILIFKVTSCFSQETSESIKLNEAWKSSTYEQLESLFMKANNRFDTVQMYSIARYMLERGKKENNHAYYINGYQLLSLTDQRLGKYKESLKHINKSIYYLEQTEAYDKKDRVYLNKGYIHQYLGEYDLALDSYTKGLSFVAEESKNMKVGFIYAIGSLKSFLYDVQGALDEYLEILRLLNEDKSDVYNNKEILRLRCLKQIARLYIDLGNYEEALNHCQEVIDAKEIIEKSNNLRDKIILVEVYMGLGCIYTFTGDYEKAFHSLEIADSMNNTVDVDYIDAFLHFFKARVFFFSGEYNKAITELNSLEALEDNYNFNHFFLEEKNILFAKSHQKLGDIEVATNYFNKSLSVLKENDERKARLNKNLLKRYDLNTLEEELTTTKTKLENQKSKTVALQVIFVMVLICLTLFYINNKRRNKKRFESLIAEIDTALKTKEEDENRQRESILKIDDVEVQKILERLQLFEKNKEYLDKETNLLTLSKKLNTNTAYLSNIINRYKKKSFNTYLMDLRLETVLERLHNEKRFRAYKIESIAEEMGFKNVNTFTRTFKKKTGINPSYFIRRLNK